MVPSISPDQRAEPGAPVDIHHVCGSLRHSIKVHPHFEPSVELPCTPRLRGRGGDRRRDRHAPPCAHARPRAPPPWKSNSRRPRVPRPPSQATELWIGSWCSPHLRPSRAAATAPLTREGIRYRIAYLSGPFRSNNPVRRPCPAGFDGGRPRSSAPAPPAVCVGGCNGKVHDKAGGRVARRTGRGLSNGIEEGLRRIFGAVEGIWALDMGSRGEVANRAGPGTKRIVAERLEDGPCGGDRAHGRHRRPEGLGVAEGCRPMRIARSTCCRVPKGSADDTAPVEAMHAIEDAFEA